MNFNSEINIIQLSALPRLLMIVAAHENLVNIFLPSLTGKSSQKITAILGNILLLSGLIPYGTKSATAQTTLACDGVVLDLLNLSNSAVVSYRNKPDGKGNELISSKVNLSADPISEANQPLRLVAAGIEDLEGNTVTGLGAIALDLVELYMQQGLTAEKAETASIETIVKWAVLLPETSSAQIAAAIKQTLSSKFKDVNTQELITAIPDSRLLTTLAGFGPSSLRALGLPNKDSELVSQTVVAPEEVGDFLSQIRSATQRAAAKIILPQAQALLIAAQERYQQELNKIRLGEQLNITTGSKVRFKFRLDNQRDNVAKIALPTAQTITADGLTGSGKVTAVTYRLSKGGTIETGDTSEYTATVVIPSQTSLELAVDVEVGETSATKVSSIAVDLQPSCGRSVIQSLNILPVVRNINGLIDPLGQLTGCAGGILPEYEGFSVALYDPDPSDDTGGSVESLTTLTNTELPDNPNNNIPQGIEPNTQNSNPFFLVNSDEGKYAFLLDDGRGQLDFGETYILVVQPPNNSIYDERRVKLVIGDRQENIVEYTAISLDGKPISAVDGETTVTGQFVLVEDAERVTLDLSVLNLSSSVCDAQEIQITKTGDRATAEPGDIVIYRIAIRNLASTPLTNLQITDTLPAGFKLEQDSVTAAVDEVEVEVNLAQSDRTVNIATDITLATNEVINLVYAAQVTPNALRGSGQNSAIVNAQRTDNNFSVQDGPAIHTLLLDPGIIEDAGTLIGRVFVDKNFDGEQQRGEAGIPNAVIYLEDGNRIITDPDGLFSVTNVLPGVHTGILDLTTIPEYRLAPNVRFIERNSNSRLVRLEPGGMARLNFGVTPTAAGKATESRREIDPKEKSSPEIELNIPNSDL
ncbi:MAG: isopeptide-forming domain-containing fimbrial protein [Waterburya sp.]